MFKHDSDIATFGGGCFWCLEAVFERLNGVISVLPGYCGGETSNPTYRDICRGDTGHAEVVQIHFDPARIDYSTLLDVFFAIHDPTTPNRQGHDVGSQYRSLIICHSSEQQVVAERAIHSFNQENPGGPHVVTEILAEQTFYPAEDHLSRPTCQLPALSVQEVCTERDLHAGISGGSSKVSRGYWHVGCLSGQTVVDAEKQSGQLGTSSS